MASVNIDISKMKAQISRIKPENMQRELLRVGAFIKSNLLVSWGGGHTIDSVALEGYTEKYKKLKADTGRSGNIVNLNYSGDFWRSHHQVAKGYEVIVAPTTQRELNKARGLMNKRSNMYDIGDGFASVVEKRVTNFIMRGDQ